MLGGVMKFAYVDETGGDDQTDVFVMTSLLVDAFRLRTCTADCDALVASSLARWKRRPRELKTKRLIEGKGGWSKIDAEERATFVRGLLDIALKYTRIFPVAFSCKQFAETAASGEYHQPFDSHWLGAEMFVSALIQRKMQEEEKNKGHTVLIFDDNKYEMTKLSDMLHDADPWFDHLYCVSRMKKGKLVWEVPAVERFNQIINTAFAIKSHHSSLI